MFKNKKIAKGSLIVTAGLSLLAFGCTQKSETKTDRFTVEQPKFEVNNNKDGGKGFDLLSMALDKDIESTKVISFPAPSGLVSTKLTMTCSSLRGEKSRTLEVKGKHRDLQIFELLPFENLLSVNVGDEVLSCRMNITYTNEIGSTNNQTFVFRVRPVSGYANLSVRNNTTWSTAEIERTKTINASDAAQIVQEGTDQPATGYLVCRDFIVKKELESNGNVTALTYLNNSSNSYKAETERNPVQTCRLVSETKAESVLRISPEFRLAFKPIQIDGVSTYVTSYDNDANQVSFNNWGFNQFEFTNNQKHEIALIVPDMSKVKVRLQQLISRYVASGEIGQMSPFDVVTLPDQQASVWINIKSQDRDERDALIQTKSDKGPFYVKVGAGETAVVRFGIRNSNLKCTTTVQNVSAENFLYEFSEAPKFSVMFNADILSSKDLIGDLEVKVGADYKFGGFFPQGAYKEVMLKRVIHNKDNSEQQVLDVLRTGFKMVAPGYGATCSTN